MANSRPWRSGAALLLSLLLIPAALRAQPSAVLTGVVTEAGGERGPLPGATVFLSGTQKGTITDADGRFTLTDVAAGQYELVVTMMGYRTARQAIVAAPSARRALRFALTAADLELPGIIVEDDGEAWRQNLGRFTAAFFGHIPNASDCRILNPTALTFARDGNVLRAQAREPLQIENRALGYRITYLVEDFEDRPAENLVRWRGNVLFSALRASDPLEARVWGERRRVAYRGSSRHFLRTLARGTAHAEGFRGYLTDNLDQDLDFDLRGHVTTPEADLSALVRTGARGRFTLDFGGRVLQVLYLNEPAHADYLVSRGLIPDAEFLQTVSAIRRQRLERQHSFFQLLRGPVAFDGRGLLLDPYASTRFGYWSWENRISNLLPFEYTDETPG